MKEKREFKLEVLPVAGAQNYKYSDEEQDRNGRFKETGTKTYKTNGDGYKIIDDYQINALGGNRYYIKVTDIKTKTEREFPAGSITAWRYMWVKPIVHGRAPNRWLPKDPIPQALGGARGAYAPLFLHLNTTTMPIAEVSTNELIFGDKWRSAMDDVAGKDPEYDKKEDFTVRVNFFRSSAKRYSYEDVGKTDIQVGPGTPPHSYNIDSYIYPTLSDEDPDGTEMYWLEKATFTYIETKQVIKEIGKPPVEEKTTHIVEVKDRVKSMNGWGRNESAGGDKYFLGEKLEFDGTSLPTVKGKLYIRVRTVQIQSYAGFSENKEFLFWRGKRGITVALGEVHLMDSANPRRRAPGVNAHYTFSSDAIASVMVHEVGHAIGMVPDGKGIRPDKGTNYYPTQSSDPDSLIASHIGPHCKYKYNYMSKDPSTSECVMFGTTTGRLTFCDHDPGGKDCKTSVKKVDISDPWAYHWD